MTDAEFVELADELALYAGDPVGFVLNMFDWNSPELKGKHPEPWQLEILQAIKDGLPLGKAVRLAAASGHGVGKTCLVSWILLWAISTREDTRGILTASNEAQLASRNRAELRKRRHCVMPTGSRSKCGALIYFLGMNTGLRRLPDCTTRVSGSSSLW